MRYHHIVALCIICLPAAMCAQRKAGTSNTSTTRAMIEPYTAYLFAYFTGNKKEEEAIHFALSKDGYHFRALNNDKPIIPSEKISETGGVRDPHILRGADNKTFYMVATDMVSANGWSSNRAMVLLKSTDLIHWTSSIVNLQKRFPGNDSLLRVWAPQTIYDPGVGKYMIYFSMKHGKDPDKIYYAYANKDFTDLESAPKQLFFSPTNGASIDGDIIEKDGKYYLFFKTEGEGSGIKIAVADNLTGKYVLRDKYVQQTSAPVEGSGVFKLNNQDGYILMYDLYTKGKYQFTYSKDLEQFKVVDQDISMNFRPRHGTVMPITSPEAARLMEEWGVESDVLQSPRAVAVRPINVSFDAAKNKITLPVKAGTALSAFDPEFDAHSGVDVSPKGPQDFSGGPVTYTVTIGNKTPKTYLVEVKAFRNPVISGFYADPDVLYSHKTGKFYIYPTSDGFTGWSGTYFKTFSSLNLVDWKDEGVILDLETNVNWAKRNAWAPTIIEKKVGSDYRYYFYFCAAQKIGVAVAGDPAGPYSDIGKPLIDERPAGARGGQQIDPAVFHDPASGKDYLYWGNGYMAVAELNDDMVSLKSGTTKLITPDATFREGAFVFYRNGKYYFLWSEDDTRSENYRVRYGTADNPLGPIDIPSNNLVIAKDPANGIFGTGHNSVLQIPGKDEWYIVYHRFNYPKGISMGEAAGYNREVCIDKMEFNADGTIQQVMPTHKGIEPVNIKK